MVVKLFELSETARKVLVLDVSGLLKDKYHVDIDSINELWDTLSIGIHVREKV